MSAIDTLREYAEVWRLFGSMPDDATLSAEVSALYLGVSVKTLARYRQTGNGPAYIQYQAEDSKARNQRVNYLLGDLKTWRDNHKVNQHRSVGWLLLLWLILPSQSLSGLLIIKFILMPLLYLTKYSRSY